MGQPPKRRSVRLRGSPFFRRCVTADTRVCRPCSRDLLNLVSPGTLPLGPSPARAPVLRRTLSNCRVWAALPNGGLLPRHTGPKAGNSISPENQSCPGICRAALTGIRLHCSHWNLTCCAWPLGACVCSRGHFPESGTSPRHQRQPQPAEAAQEPRIGWRKGVQQHGIGLVEGSGARKSEVTDQLVLVGARREFHRAIGKKCAPIAVRASPFWRSGSSSCRCPASSIIADLASTIFAGSPPVLGPAAGRRRYGSWVGQIPG